MAFIPARNQYFCNYCRTTVDAAQGAPSRAAGPAAPAVADAIPPELAGSLPAAPPPEATLYVPTSDPRPIVRRSSLRKGTVEALADSEVRQAMQSGDFIILSKPGRCAIVAARKALGEAPIVPLALDSPGEPWRVRIVTADVGIEVGLFKPRPMPPSRMAPPNAPPPEEFHVAYYVMKGPPPRLAAFVAALLELLNETPWASEHWPALSRALNVPASKLMLDWKQYADYAGARAAIADVAAAQEALRQGQREGIASPDARSAIERAKSELAQGEYDAALLDARKAGEELSKAHVDRQKSGEAQEKVKLAVNKIRRLDAESREAEQIDELATAAAPGASTAAADARERMETLLDRAGKQLYALYAARANQVLGGIQGEDESLVGEIRGSLESHLAGGRKRLEEGDIEGGDGALETAINSARERIDEFLKDAAASSIGELEELYGGSKENSAFDTDFRSRIERTRREIDARMQAGKNKEACQLARALIKGMEERLESSAPVIRVTIVGPRLVADTWNKVVMKIQNSGNADAASVQVSIDGPVELRALDELPLLRAGETYNDEIGVKCEENGSIPVKLLVDCERPHDSTPFHFEAELWLEFEKPLDLSGAKTITIDRSVHIVDSVLNRSQVAEDEGAGGVPAVPEDAGKVDDGRVEITDSVINRAGGPKASAGAAGSAEVRCPSCGRMISADWKRCPYCSG
jgi:hypothetical protein